MHLEHACHKTVAAEPTAFMNTWIIFTVIQWIFVENQVTKGKYQEKQIKSIVKSLANLLTRYLATLVQSKLIWISELIRR